MSYVIEYDSLNRIVKEDITELESEDTTTPLSTYSYTYNKDGLIEQKRVTKYSTIEDKKQGNPDDNFTDYYHYTISDTLITIDIERRYTMLEGNNFPLADTLSTLIYLNDLKQAYKIAQKSFRYSTTTEIRCNSSSMIQKLIETHTFIYADEPFIRETKIIASDKRNGIFKNVNFNPILQTQLIGRLYLLFTVENPTILISTNNSNDDSDSETSEEKTEFKYSYNTAGYPISFTSNSSNEEYKPEEFKIEYITIKQ